ncbi:TIGR03546 family protein [Lacipirellula sp.]|uniref:TIGR03546 family protein n=1 Tax=Lacipirellula sp. TaxID=2691419 RepID=UPI003D0E5B99
MFTLFLRPVRMLAQALIGNDTPRQTAWGFSLGMMVGLLPKGNLTAIVIAMLLFSFRVNRAAGFLAIAMFSYLGAWFDDTAHRLGSYLLTSPTLQAMFAAVYDKPLGPFSGLNNTVVLGQLLIGLYLFYPVYRGSRLAATYLRPRLQHYLMRYRLVRWLMGAEIGAQWGLE